MSDPSRSQHQSRWRSDPEPSSSQGLNSPHSRPTLPPMRYPGDGYDFRRPIMSDPPQREDVIDLTNEPDSLEEQRRPQNSDSRTTPRLPRFGRNIMAEVVDLEEPEDIIRIDTPSSPEVQFVRATVRQPEPVPAPPPRNRGFIGANLWDLIRLQREMAPRHLISREESFRQEIAWRARDLHRRPPDEVDMFLLGAAEEAIDLEDAMDLAIVGDRPLRAEYPTYGLTSGRGSRQSSYKAPSPPSEGFTRSAGEDDLVVCPNCDEELGIGDETKQQIWVAKPCGHVRATLLHDVGALLTFSRYTVANVPGIVLFPRPRRLPREPNRFLNVKSLIVVNPSVHPDQCSRYTFDHLYSA